MEFEFELSTDPLQKILKKLPQETQKKVVRNAVRAGAKVIAEEAIQLAPYDLTRKSGTHLIDAIIVRRIRNTNDVFRIGTIARDAPHAHLLEFGTVKMQPQPFLRPAVDNVQGGVAIKMMKILNRGILREMKKLSKGRK